MGRGSIEGVAIMSTMRPSADFLRSAIILYDVGGDKEVVYRQLVSVTENCPPRLRQYVAAAATGAG